MTMDEDITLHPQQAPTSRYEREQRMQALAMQLSERHLIEGTASSAELLFWLERSTLEHEIKVENKMLEGQLLRAKADAIKSDQANNEAYAEAMRAFAGYSPTKDDDGYLEGEFNVR